MSLHDPVSQQEVPVAIPANGLAVLVGASGSGKSAWAARWFAETQVVSSDRCRALVADDETDQGVNRQAFAVFHEIIRRRLELGRLTVADSTALSVFARERLRHTAARTGAPVVALAFCTPPNVLLRHNGMRRRHVPDEVILRHAVELRELVLSPTLGQEGYDAVHLLFYPKFPPPVIVPPVSARSGAEAPEAS